MSELRFTGHHGVMLSAEDFGHPDDPSVVLVPSTGQTKEMWFGAAEALAAAGRYAVCVDLRGHGASGFANDGGYAADDFAKDLRAILAQLRSRATVVAVGSAGMAATLALEESTAPLASALVLIGVTTRADAATLVRVEAAWRARPYSFSSQEEAMAALASIHPFEPAPRAKPGLLAAFAAAQDGRLAWRGDSRALCGFDFANAASRVEAEAANLRIPVFLMRGTLNESVSAEAMAHLASLFPDAETVEIGGAGHHLPVDREDEFNAALLDFLERRVPRRATLCEGGSDPRVLRDALGCFSTGVTIVTARDPSGAPIGLTANSFTSVSLDPPLILFCIAKSSANLNTFAQASGFGVNILHIGQQPASARFARADGERFEGLACYSGPATAVPLLNGSLASFDCRRHAVHDGGDHLIFIGEVRYVAFEPHRDPLLYFRGKYRRLHFA